MADQDPSGFTLYPAGNGTEAFVYPEALLFMGMRAVGCRCQLLLI